MTDALLRHLERRWRETRTVDDEARYLLERLRVGQLRERGLIVAAGLGHEASRRIAPAVGLDALDLIGTPESSIAGDRSGSPRARSAVALAREMVRQYAEVAASHPEAAGAMPVDVRAHLHASALDAAEDWVLCPCDRHTSALTCFEAIPVNDCVPECCWDAEDHPGQVVAFALNALAECAGVEVRCQTWFPSLSEMLVAEGEQDRAGPLAEAARAAIRAELIPWALEEVDLLAQRVRARSSR